MTEPGGKGRHPSQYLNDLEEWGEKQYSPGHWMGGHLPPLLKYPGWPVMLFILVGSIFGVVAALSTLASAPDIYNRLTSLLMLLITGTLLAGSLAWFFRHRRKRREIKHRPKH